MLRRTRTITCDKECKCCVTPLLSLTQARIGDHDMVRYTEHSAVDQTTGAPRVSQTIAFDHLSAVAKDTSPHLGECNAIGSCFASCMTTC